MLDSFSDPLFRLQIAHSVKDVAYALGLDPEKFFYVVQHASDGTYYREFEISKKRGGVRNISSPRKGLALSQDRLAAVIAARYVPKKHVKGFVKGESFLTNARYHERQKWVLNIDVKDFYPSIGFARVRGLFLSSYFGFNGRVATILARITTYKDQLPQGAKTSPLLANIIANNLDKRLLEVASRSQLRYTRYADDITISSSKRAVPADIVQSWEPEFGNRVVHLGRAVTEAFRHSGFEINHSKSRILFPYERQEVTGLVVNRRANVWRRDVSRLRMKLHSIKRYGASAASGVWLGGGADGAQMWRHVSGQLSFIRQVRGADDPVLAKLCKAAVIAGLKGPEWVIKVAEMVREFDVFLSHASEDKEKVRRLKDRLEGLGVSVFFDETSIGWGDSIVDSINHGLLKSTYFVPFLSETFSRKGWTNKELNSAISLNIGRKGRILPIIDSDFSVEENYPLLNETLYEKWPQEVAAESAFIDKVADSLLLLIEEKKQKV
ncbi:TIR domain-containing anti-phage reverse transcriptase [Nitratireductor sp. GZWM139]|uniref:TIR domain-containing anti-phage reverse transcriptase n=1 Tax=Nitratireductor sp. GZWM139 TaxID=2950541 RepID=UPI0024BDB80C|nr:TIR domain-containing anti-phage reverse transcriptase [Nitratireductor sp. GZWM139]MDJ1464197.1 reverse transcriptase domain-containing protein [Nitratireductor sp. GZWM139]